MIKAYTFDSNYTTNNIYQLFDLKKQSFISINNNYMKEIQ